MMSRAKVRDPTVKGHAKPKKRASPSPPSSPVMTSPPESSLVKNPLTAKKKDDGKIKKRRKKARVVKKKLPLLPLVRDTVAKINSDVTFTPESLVFIVRYAQSIERTMIDNAVMMARVTKKVTIGKEHVIHALEMMDFDKRAISYVIKSVEMEEESTAADESQKE